MSDKDFANLETSQIENDAHKESPSAKPTLIVTLALMFSIVCFAIGFFMGEKYGLETTKGNKHATLLSTVQAQQEELERLKKEAEKWHQKEANTSQVGELTFYNELPKQSIMPEPLHSEATSPSASDVQRTNLEAQAHSAIDENTDNIEAAEEKLDAIIEQELKKPTRTFRIQLASFKNKKDSENLVRSLKEAGLEATIQRVDLANLGVRHRVNTVSFDQHHLALRAKQMVKEKFGITGIIISE